MQLMQNLATMLQLSSPFRECSGTAVHTTRQGFIQVLSLTSCVTLNQLPRLPGFPHFQSENSDVPTTSNEIMYMKNL